MRTIKRIIPVGFALCLGVVAPRAAVVVESPGAIVAGKTIAEP